MLLAGTGNFYILYTVHYPGNSELDEDKHESKIQSAQEWVFNHPLALIIEFTETIVNFPVQVQSFSKEFNSKVIGVARGEMLKTWVLEKSCSPQRSSY